MERCSEVVKRMCVAATGKACLSQAISYDDAEAGFSPAPASASAAALQTSCIAQSSVPHFISL